MVDQPVEDAGVRRDDGSDRAFAAMLPDAVAHAVVEALRGGVSMDMSPKFGELVKALCLARLSFETIDKDRKANIPGKDGKTGYSYGYATLASALDSTATALANNQLVAVNLFHQEPGLVEVECRLLHASEQWISSSLSLPVPTSGLGPQVLGSLVTYLRRYVYLALLGIAPSQDDDGEDGQRGADHDASSVEAVVAKLRTDVAAGIAEVRAVVTSAAGCGDISTPRLNRLYTVATREKGWTEAEVTQACLALLGVQAPQVPWKAYDVVVALFQTLTPAQARDSRVGGAASKGGGSKTTSPPPAAAKPPAAQAAPAPAPSSPPAPTLGWDELWAKIRDEYDDLKPEALADPIDAGSLPAVMQGFGRSGWTAKQVAAVLLAELRIEPTDLPKDGTNPPVFRKIAKAFREFKPADIPAPVRERYRAASVARGDAPEEAVGADPAPSVSDILASMATPTTAAEAWGEIRKAIDLIRTTHPDAMVPCSPDDRLTLIGYKAQNGNRTSGDVAALLQHHLHILVDELPAVMFETTLAALAGFPSVGSGREEMLLRLPTDLRTAKTKDLGELLHSLINVGVLTDEEVPRSGAGNTVSKADMGSTIERVRERLLMEGGYAG